jgi:hypothetical protein
VSCNGILWCCKEISFLSLILTSVCLLTVGVEVVVTLGRTQWHTNTHAVGLLWTRDRPIAETFAWKHTAIKGTENNAPAVFEPAILATERPQTHVLDRAATGIGGKRIFVLRKRKKLLNQLLTLWLTEGYVTLNVNCFEKRIEMHIKQNCRLPK